MAGAFRPTKNQVVTVGAGEAAVFETAGFGVRITVITGTGATATVSRVDSFDADAHTTGSENQFTVAANTRQVTDADWPFYRVSSAGGTTRVAYV